MGYGYKLLRQRKDGSLGSLFINRAQRLEVGQVYESEDHPTKGYQHRPRWHVLRKPEAPHLSTRGRVWAKVRYTGGVEIDRPPAQGGRWVLARTIEILDLIPHDCVEKELELCCSIESTLKKVQERHSHGLQTSAKQRN